MNSDSTGRIPLLFLCHRIPYPPNKGDKIRSFHLLHHLAQYFDIHLATFIDDPADKPWISNVRKYCKSAVFLDLSKQRATLRSLRAFVSNAPLSIPYYADKGMQEWVDSTLKEHGIRHVLVFSSSMAQYVMNSGVSFERKVLDFVDIDSDKWQQYAEQQSWPKSWVYRREARCLLDYEGLLADYFDSGLFVSSAEAAMFRKLRPENADKIGFYNNGVNAEYFSPELVFDSPYPDGARAVVFTGAMDYWPNVDAAEWFADRVFPSVRKACPEARFYVVGSNPARSLDRIKAHDGVVVTGRVEDIRPYIAHAAAAVAPMRVARGVQNKVLEAMAMARPVVVSPKGLEGIDAEDGSQLLVAETEAECSARVLQLLTGEHTHLGEFARKFVVNCFSWENNLPEVVQLLGHDPEPPAPLRAASA